MLIFMKVVQRIHAVLLLVVMLLVLFWGFDFFFPKVYLYLLQISKRLNKLEGIDVRGNILNFLCGNDVH